MALFESLVVALAERHEQMTCPDDLALLDQLLGDLLRSAADELLVAEGGNRFVGAIEQRSPRRQRAGAGVEHVEQGTLGPMHCIALLRRFVDERDHSAHSDLFGAVRVSGLRCAVAIRIEHLTDLLRRQEAATRLPSAPAGLLCDAAPTHRGPQRRRGLLQASRQDLEIVEVPLRSVVRDHWVLQRCVEHVDDLGVARRGDVGRDADDRQLGRNPADDPDLQATVGEVIEHGDLLDDAPRRRVRTDRPEHAESQAGGPRRDVGDQQVR